VMQAESPDQARDRQLRRHGGSVSAISERCSANMICPAGICTARHHQPLLNPVTVVVGAEKLCRRPFAASDSITALLQFNVVSALRAYFAARSVAARRVANSARRANHRFPSSPRLKNIPLFRIQNQVYSCSVPRPTRGTFRDRHDT
jgi:hypothetical protein